MNTQKFNIRNYQAEDITAILGVFDELCPEYFAPKEQHDFIEYLTNKREAYFVIQENRTQKIVGAGGYNLLENHTLARLSWDLIALNYQGFGLGTLLTNFRISEIRLQPNVSTIAVRTSPKAYQYYAACGFSLQEIHSDYWAKGFDLYYMVFDR